MGHLATDRLLDLVDLVLLDVKSWGARRYRELTGGPIEATLGFARRGDTTFVGRQADFRRLEQIWAAVEDDRRQVVFVGGEPGVGKTRLVAEAVRHLRAHGAHVLRGACLADFDIPYRPFVTILEQVLDDVAPGELPGVVPDVASPLLRLAPRARRHWPDVEESQSQDHESRPVLFDAVLRILVAVAERRPTVLVLEHLHWASEPTLAMLTHLVQSTAGEQLVVLATRRTTAPDRTEAVTYALADLHRLDGVDRIDLDGLSTEDALARRLAVIGRDHARVIEVAAVAGELVDLSVIVQACGLGPDAALEGLDFGVRAGLLEADPHSDGTYQFTHALARQAVLARMPAAVAAHRSHGERGARA